jgi:hypothetical protein
MRGTSVADIKKIGPRPEQQNQPLFDPDRRDVFLVLDIHR